MSYREIKPAYTRDDEQIYVYTNSDGVYVGEEESKTLTNKLSEIDIEINKGSQKIEQVTTQLSESVKEINEIQTIKADKEAISSIQTQIDNIVVNTSNIKAYKGSNTTTNILALTGMLEGDCWYSTDDLIYYLYNGTIWIDIGDSSAEIAQARSNYNNLNARITANENGTNLSIFKKEFKKVFINSKNILRDVFLDNVTLNDTNTTIEITENDSNIIHLSNTGVETSFNIPFDYFKSAFIEDTTIYLHFKAKTIKNNQTGYAVPSLAFYQYLGTSLKGAKSQVLTFSDDYINYILPMSFSTGASYINKFKVISQKPCDIYFKDFYITFSYKNEEFNLIKKTINDLVPPIVTNLLPQSNEIIKTKLTILGDSLSDESIEPLNKYPKWLREKANYEVTNLAVSGSGYFNPSSHNTQFYNQALNVQANTDIVMIFGSFNDMSRLYNGEATIGTLSDTGTTTIYGCINKTLDNIYNINPSMVIALVTPTPWTGMNEQMTVDNPYYGFVHDYIDALKTVANKRQIPILDLFHCSALRPWIKIVRDGYYQNADGTHPNEAGHLKYLYPHMREFLNTMNFNI